MSDYATISPTTFDESFFVPLISDIFFAKFFTLMMPD